MEGGELQPIVYLLLINVNISRLITSIRRSYYPIKKNEGKIE